MNFHLVNAPEKNTPDSTVSQIPQPVVQPLHSVNEFPDTVIRVTHQATMYTEGCVAAGCPEDLF
jgi:hypothetical protein